MANEIYSDVNLLAGVLSPYVILIDGSAVNQNILVLCDTPVGSKWHRPRIGSVILSYLFDPFDEDTASAIETELSSMLKDNGEYRVVVNSVEVLPDWNNARYYVSIIYTVPAINPRRIKFDFYLSKEKVA